MNKERIILYIDDEEKNLSSFKAVFRKDYKILLASSAEEGIHMMEEHPISLVITDQRMPNMTGVEFLERIVHRHPDVARIILTGYSDMEATIQAINKGQVYRYITKPWRKDELKETIDKALDYHFLRQENKELIEHLQKINQELDRFVYSAAHDLRAPVTSLMGLMNLMREETDLQKLQQYRAMGEATIGKLDHFIQEIIDYSYNQRAQIAPDAIDFEEVARFVWGKFEMEAAQKGIVFELSVSQSSAFYTDLARLELIIKSLISNALRFYNPHATPSPTCRLRIEAGEEACLTIEDNGIGIEEAHIDKIFDMFYRATAHRVGSGLGLFLVRETVHKLHGSIAVSSKSGEGSCFVVRLPNLHPA